MSISELTSAQVKAIQTVLHCMSRDVLPLAVDGGIFDELRKRYYMSFHRVYDAGIIMGVVIEEFAKDYSSIFDWDKFIAMLDIGVPLVKKVFNDLETHEKKNCVHQWFMKHDRERLRNTRIVVVPIVGHPTEISRYDGVEYKFEYGSTKRSDIRAKKRYAEDDIDYFQPLKVTMTKE